MQSLRLTTRRLASTASRTALNSNSSKQVLRRNYASSSEGHAKPKSNEITWALGAVAITIPGLYFALKPSADSGHHDSHDDHDHDSHEDKDAEDDEAKEEDAPEEKDSEADSKSEDSKDEGEDRPESKSDDKDEKSDEDGDAKSDDKDADSDDSKDDGKADSKNSQGGEDPSKPEKNKDSAKANAMHPRLQDPKLSNKKESGLPATVKEKKGHEGRL